MNTPALLDRIKSAFLTERPDPDGFLRRHAKWDPAGDPWMDAAAIHCRLELDAVTDEARERVDGLRRLRAVQAVRRRGFAMGDRASRPPAQTR